MTTRRVKKKVFTPKRKVAKVKTPSGLVLCLNSVDVSLVQVFSGLMVKISSFEFVTSWLFS